MSKGGYVNAIGTWTVDTKQSVDEYLAFITSAGQVFVYQGTDPNKRTYIWPGWYLQSWCSYRKALFPANLGKPVGYHPGWGDSHDRDAGDRQIGRTQSCSYFHDYECHESGSAELFRLFSAGSSSRIQEVHWQFLIFH